MIIPQPYTHMDLPLQLMQAVKVVEELKLGRACVWISRAEKHLYVGLTEQEMRKLSRRDDLKPWAICNKCALVGELKLADSQTTRFYAPKDGINISICKEHSNE